MSSQISRFALTHGQVAWAISNGMPPSRHRLDELRYLRQLGIPFVKAELGGGRGNPLRYDYDHLIETGVAHFGMNRGLRPRELTILVEDRNSLRPMYRRAFREQPETAIESDWPVARDTALTPR
jgi:hypothetical protein